MANQYTNIRLFRFNQLLCGIWYSPHILQITTFPRLSLTFVLLFISVLNEFFVQPHLWNDSILPDSLLGLFSSYFNWHRWVAPCKIKYYSVCNVSKVCIYKTVLTSESHIQTSKTYCILSYKISIYLSANYSENVLVLSLIIKYIIFIEIYIFKNNKKLRA